MASSGVWGSMEEDFFTKSQFWNRNQDAAHAQTRAQCEEFINIESEISFLGILYKLELYFKDSYMRKLLIKRNIAA